VAARDGSASRVRISEVIEMKGVGVLDLGRARIVEQEVLDLLEEPRTR
jgi:hypothetical protein